MSRSDFLRQLAPYRDDIKYAPQYHFYGFADFKSKRYNFAQKMYVIQRVAIAGGRATARAIEIPRRTIQRWLRKYGVSVKRCPDWVKPWAERRRKRRFIWAQKGYV